MKTSTLWKVSTDKKAAEAANACQSRNETCGSGLARESGVSFNIDVG
ncbi:MULTISPECIES: hypothetical protein [Pseudomonas]|nr:MULTISPECIES: hypothetical protein [Pseudomonas]